ncbi:MAG: hypothetical protein R2825_10720 [Saprospiraceae bacterium]
MIFTSSLSNKAGIQFRTVGRGLFLTSRSFGFYKTQSDHDLYHFQKDRHLRWDIHLDGSKASANRALIIRVVRRAFRYHPSPFHVERFELMHAPQGFRQRGVGCRRSGHDFPFYDGLFGNEERQPDVDGVGTHEGATISVQEALKNWGLISSIWKEGYPPLKINEPKTSGPTTN